MNNLEKQKVLEYKQKGLSNREISRLIFGRSSKESTIRSFLKKNPDSNLVVKKDKLNILFWDVETSIKRSWHFRQDGYLGSDLIDKDVFLLSQAWQWGNSDFVESCRISGADAKEENDFDLVLKVWCLLDNAHIVVGHNLDKFDIKMVNARFLYHGLPPPSPYKTIDTLKLARRKFGITFKSLKYLCEFLKLPVQKLSHAGVSLWISATLGDEKSLIDMETYNRGDIPTLKLVYDRLASWGTGSTNVGYMRSQVEEIETLLCPSCGDHNVKSLTNPAFTGVAKYEAYRCDTCSAVSRLSSKTQSANMKLVSV